MSHNGQLPQATPVLRKNQIRIAGGSGQTLETRRIGHSSLGKESSTTKESDLKKKLGAIFTK